MKISIQKIRTASRNEWVGIWKQCPYATFFHSPYWAEIWERYSSGQLIPSPRMIEFSDDVAVLLPLSVRKACFGLIKTHIMSPAGTYGGWISAKETTSRHAEKLIDYLMNELSRLRWRINPFNSTTCSGTFEDGIVDEDFTQIIDLKQGFESIFARWSEDHQRSTRKARKEGIQIDVADTKQSWQEYFTVYQSALDRWGEDATSRYSRELFDIIRSFDPSLYKLWVARYDGKIVAGALCFYTEKHAVYWHGAGLKKYFDKCPNQLLFYHIIKDAVDHDLTWFDFNPSSGLEGVVTFKRKFGAVKRPSPVITMESPLASFYTFLGKLCSL